MYERVTFKTLVCSEKQGLLSDCDYARAASKKKSKNRSTGLGSRRMIFHTSQKMYLHSVFNTVALHHAA